MVSPEEPVRKDTKPEAHKQSNENTPEAISFRRSFFCFSVLRVLGKLLPANAKQSSFLKNGAGFGDVGVEGFDDGGVLLLNDAALEL